MRTNQPLKIAGRDLEVGDVMHFPALRAWCKITAIAPLPEHDMVILTAVGNGGGAHVRDYIGNGDELHVYR